MALPFIGFPQLSVESIENHIRNGSYQKAQLILQESIKKDPDPILKDKLGEVFGYQQQWDKAIEVYRELTIQYPQNPEFQFRYGGVLAKKAQNSNLFMALPLLGKIKASFKKALKLDPEHIGAHWALIDLYVSLPALVGGSISNAYDHALKLKELSAVDGYLALGYVYEYDEAPEQAKINYLKALTLLDKKEIIDRNQLNYQIGKICAEFEIEMDKGIIHLNEYIHNYTVLDGVPLEWAYYRLAKIYRKKSERQKALVWINRSLEISPGLEPALTEKSAIERL
ncbi:MAG: tetratricopeptide repeat protein [Flavobacteriaceae bacterium]